MIRSTHTLSLALGLALLTGPALASSHKPKFDGNGPGASAAARDCPPGLAKRNPPCIPPGQAKRGGYEIGEALPGDLVLVRRYDDLDLPVLDANRYYRTDDYVYEVDPDTRAILDAIAIAEVLLN